jgi:hypothetical protein
MVALEGVAFFFERGTPVGGVPFPGGSGRRGCGLEAGCRTPDRGNALEFRGSSDRDNMDA